MLSAKPPKKYRLMLKATQWEYRPPNEAVLKAFRTLGLEAFELANNDLALDEIRTLLELPRDFNDVRFRIRGFIAGRPGLSASDFKSKARLKGALRAIHRGTQRPFVRPPPAAHSPAAQGQLDEQEICARTAAVQPLEHFSMAKNRTKTSHPILGFDVNSSADGRMASPQLVAPVELKTKPEIAHLGPSAFGIAQQLAIQAFAEGVDHGCLLLVERPTVGAKNRPGFTVIVVSRLFEFHAKALQGWIDGDPELALLVGQLSEGAGA